MSSVRFSASTDSAAAPVLNDSLEMVRHVLSENRSLNPQDLSSSDLLSEAIDEAFPDSRDPDGGPRWKRSRQVQPGLETGKRGSDRLSEIKDYLKYIRIAGFYGYSRDERIQLIHPKWLTAGFRSTVRGTTGYLRLAAAGPLETIATGNLRAGFGEGLLLGGRDPRTTPLCAARRTGDLRISTSLSCWERTKGLGGRLRLGNVRLGAIVWERGEAEAVSLQREAWLSASCVGNGWWAGLVSGHLLHAVHRPSVQHFPPRALALSLRASREFTDAASARRIRTGFSGEMAVWDGEAMYVFAVGFRGRCTGWIRVFRQPATSGFGRSANGLSRVDRILQGSAMHWKKRIGTKKIECSVYDGSIRGSTQSSRYRRATIRVQEKLHRSPRHILAVSASVIERQKMSFSSDELSTVGKSSDWMEKRLGLRWDINAGAYISHRLRADLRFSQTGRVVGTAISTGSCLTSRWGELVFRYTNFSFTAPAYGFVTRPGVGPFEHLSFVHGGGSDFSLRAKLWICPWFDILAYYGRPWEKQGRMYIGVKYPR